MAYFLAGCALLVLLLLAGRQFAYANPSKLVGAMRKTFAQIRRDGGIHGVESEIATVEDVFDLQGMAKVKDDEKRFLK